MSRGPLGPRLRSVEGALAARLERMPVHRLEALVGPRSGEYLDTLPLEAVYRIAQGDHEPIQASLAAYDRWLESQA
jgi:hypothetical protein